MATTHAGKDDAKHKDDAKRKDETKHADAKHADAKGQKHVTQEQVGSGKEHDPNNFANNPERAAAAGHKGGKSSHG